MPAPASDAGVRPAPDHDERHAESQAKFGGPAALA